MINNEKQYELLKFEDGETSRILFTCRYYIYRVYKLESKSNVWKTHFANSDKTVDTVCLTQSQMSSLCLHIKNILLEKELNASTSEEYSIVQQEGTRKVKRKLKILLNKTK